jgi:hypothetical protein
VKTDEIKQIKIDESGRFCIWPAKEKFEFIWRSATEVHWDTEGMFLYSPKPREWSYLNWFSQIIGAVKSEYGIKLLLSNKTLWINIPEDLKNQIKEQQN